MKNCIECGKKFKPKQKTQKFCNKNCVKRSQRKRYKVKLKEPETLKTIELTTDANSFTESVFSVPDKIVVELERLNDWITIVPVGDIHKFSPNHSEHAWQEFLENEREALEHDKHRYYIFLGDELECFSYKEQQNLAKKNFHESGKAIIDIMMQDMGDKFLKDIEFMKGHVVGMAQGNHSYEFASGETMTQYFCRKMGVAGKPCWYLGTVAGIQFVFGYKKTKKKKAYDVWVCHGEGTGTGGRLLGATLNTLERFSNVFVGDLYLMGHDHQKAVGEPVKIELSGSTGQTIRVNERVAKAVRAGSFLKSYEKNKSAYSHRKLFRPVPLGDPPIIKVRMKQCDMGNNLKAVTKVTT